MTGQTTLHVSGFVDDGRVSDVQITSYDGPLEDVVPGIVEEIERHGHTVRITTTRPLGGGALSKVELTVTVVGKGHEPTDMWHAFTYASDRWPTKPAPFNDIRPETDPS